MRPSERRTVIASLLAIGRAASGCRTVDEFAISRKTRHHPSVMRSDLVLGALTRMGLLRAGESPTISPSPAAFVRHRARGSRMWPDLPQARAAPAESRGGLAGAGRTQSLRGRMDADGRRIVPGAVPRILGEDRESGCSRWSSWMRRAIRSGRRSCATANSRSTPRARSAAAWRQSTSTPPATPRSRGILRPTIFSFRSASSPTCPPRRSKIPTVPRDSKT